jgi:hypothetical protein
MFGKKKIKIEEWDGRKIDSAVIKCEKDADELFERWKKKGLI